MHIEEMTKDAGFDVDEVPIPVVASRNVGELEVTESDADDPEAQVGVSLTDQQVAQFDADARKAYPAELIEEALGVEKQGSGSVVRFTRMTVQSIKEMFDKVVKVKEKEEEVKVGEEDEEEAKADLDVTVRAVTKADEAAMTSKSEAVPEKKAMPGKKRRKVVLQRTYIY